MKLPAKQTLSLHDVAKRLDVHYMTVYRYVRSGRLRAQQNGGEWEVATDDLREFMESRTAKHKKRSPRAKHGARPAADWAKRFENCIVAGDETGASQVLEDALASGRDLFELYLEVVSPALVSIGERWRNGKLQIHEEHRASTIVARLLGRVSTRFAHRGVSRGTVVIGGPSGERHGLAITMVADLLRSRGWTVSDIGPDVPAESFAIAAADVDQLRAVCVGVTLSDSLPAARETVAALRRKLGTRIAIYVGGAAIMNDEMAHDLGADAWARDPRTLVALLAA